jgi:hypothetical protein
MFGASEKQVKLAASLKRLTSKSYNDVDSMVEDFNKSTSGFANDDDAPDDLSVKSKDASIKSSRKSRRTKKLYTLHKIIYRANLKII